VNWNYARWLAEAVDSALSQTWPATEVIVVDDGSTDGSRAILERFRTRVRVLFQEHAGASSARNRGFAAASGEIILFLDSDDLLRPRAVADVVARWRPDVSKVQFRLELVDAAGRPTGAIMPNAPRRLDAALIAARFHRTGLYPWPPMSGNAYTRTFLERVMPLPTDRFPAVSDAVLNTLAPLYGAVEPIDEPLGSYRVHEHNVSGRSGFEPQTLLREVALLGQALEMLRVEAQALGIEPPGRGLDELPLLERRMVLAKLGCPAAASDRTAQLAARAVRRLFDSNEPLHHCVARAAWLAGTVFLPRAAAARLATLRFSHSARPRALVEALVCARVLR
jgi:hypothetical protein